MEHAWISGDTATCRAELEQLSKIDPVACDLFETGDIVIWAHLVCVPLGQLLLKVQGDAAQVALKDANRLLTGLAAMPALALLRTRAKAKGIVIKQGRQRPFSAVRAHPLGLTQREAEVLHPVADGLTNLEIAQTLGRSERTVEQHVSAVMGKAGKPNRLALMLYPHDEPWLATMGLAS